MQQTMIHTFLTPQHSTALCGQHTSLPRLPQTAAEVQAATAHSRREFDRGRAVLCHPCQVLAEALHKTRNATKKENA